MFACAVAKMALCIVDQLLKSATSVGANLEEAKAGSSRREFVRYVEIALREARETAYWLRICVVLRVGPDEELKRLTDEASQICRILGSIVVKTKLHARAGLAVSALFALLTVFAF